MNSAARAKAILIDPVAEWTRIQHESGDLAYLLSRYVAVLALVPALCGLVGTSVIGVVVPGMGTVRTPIFDGLFGAIFGYVATVVTVLSLAVLINLLAPLFGAQKDFDSAAKLAVYSYTPVWLSGIFLLLPGLRFLILLSFYGAYVLAVGLPRLMKSPVRKSYGYALVVVVCACALTLIAAAIQHSVFHTAGL
jgi:hypothetical protein